MNVSSQYVGFLAACILPLSAPADADGPEFGANAGAGYRYDSNVNIAATDTNTGEADSALFLNLGIDGAVPLGQRLSLGFGYGYTDTAYSTFSKFDLAVHHARAALRYRVAGFDSAVSFDRFEARVDGENFLDIRQASPSLSRLVGQRLYLRGSVIRAHKVFAGNPERDAFNNAVRGDAYVLIDGMERYVALTYRIDDDDAKAREFDYRGTAAKLTYRQPLQVGRMTLDWKVQVQVENRSYAGESEQAGTSRRDERWRAGMSAALPLWGQVALKGEVEYGSNSSSLAAASFDETVYSVGIAADL